MTRSNDGPPPMAFAMQWLARMTTIILEMLLPGLGGQWLDGRLGTQYWVIVGFVLGFVIAIVHLLSMIKRYGSDPTKPPGDQ